MILFICLLLFGVILAVVAFASTESFGTSTHCNVKTIPLAEDNLNSQLGIRRKPEVIVQKELPCEIKDMILNRLKDNFKDSVKKYFRIYFVLDDFNDDPTLVTIKKHGAIITSPCYYKAVIELILMQGFEYSNVDRHMPYYAKVIDVKLPIFNGEVYDSAMRLWQMHKSDYKKSDWIKHFSPIGCVRTIGNSIIVQ